MNIGSFVLACVCSCRSNFREFIRTGLYIPFPVLLFKKMYQQLPTWTCCLCNSSRRLSPMLVPGCCRQDLRRAAPCFSYSVSSSELVGNTFLQWCDQDKQPSSCRLRSVSPEHKAHACLRFSKATLCTVLNQRVPG